MPFGPESVPPTPIQAPTWPAATAGVWSGTSVAPTPWALLSLCRPAYEYSRAPQALDLELRPSATEAARRASTRAARTESVRRAKKTSGPRRRRVCRPFRDRSEARGPDPSNQGQRAGSRPFLAYLGGLGGTAQTVFRQALL